MQRFDFQPKSGYKPPLPVCCVCHLQAYFAKESAIDEAATEHNPPRLAQLAAPHAGYGSAVLGHVSA
jgi:hypothetical protein